MRCLVHPRLACSATLSHVHSAHVLCAFICMWYSCVVPRMHRLVHFVFYVVTLPVEASHIGLVDRLYNFFITCVVPRIHNGNNSLVSLVNLVFYVVKLPIEASHVGVGSCWSRRHTL